MSNQISYCLFRKGSVWFAMPARVIREVMPRPNFVSIPRTHLMISGLSHIRSEFLPVLNFSSLLPDESFGKEQFLLNIEESDQNWGLLVDEVDSLAVLEHSDAPEEGRSDWESAITGWAKQGDRIIRILDSIRFLELATRELSAISRSESRSSATSSTLEEHEILWKQESPGKLESAVTR